MFSVTGIIMRFSHATHAFLDLYKPRTLKAGSTICTANPYNFKNFKGFSLM